MASLLGAGVAADEENDRDAAATSHNHAHLIDRASSDWASDLDGSVDAMYALGTERLMRSEPGGDDQVSLLGPNPADPTSKSKLSDPLPNIVVVHGEQQPILDADLKKQCPTITTTTTATTEDEAEAENDHLVRCATPSWSINAPNQPPPESDDPSDCYCSSSSSSSSDHDHSDTDQGLDNEPDQLVLSLLHGDQNKEVAITAQTKKPDHRMSKQVCHPSTKTVSVVELEEPAEVAAIPYFHHHHPHPHHQPQQQQPRSDPIPILGPAPGTRTSHPYLPTPPAATATAIATAAASLDSLTSPLQSPAPSLSSSVPSSPSSVSTLSTSPSTTTPLPFSLEVPPSWT